MIRQKIVSAVSGLIIYSMFITPVVFGQFNSQPDTQVNNTKSRNKINFSDH